MEKLFEKFGYLQLALVVAGQIFTVINPKIACVLYTLGNIIAVSRCVILKRPTSDKIKDFTLLGISVACAII